MEYKNIEDIKRNVEACVKFHGFEVEDCKWATLGITIKTNSDYVRIDISSDLHMNFEERVVIQNFEFCPTICRMGGHNTSEELRTIADDMRRIANLVDDLSLRGGYSLVVEMP